ncbi:transposon Ty3-I Gag-Pol polyprotein [Trichonephila clavipes]|uniref:RNA-directed DNA polymerase n=1 Tax=Trichonephila clavipes TaxID=2585209 RepID=A0A8X6VNF7_TRICX|nr:transposon Ty3-I Gag-Pol polyprotein [Trichonephila clavipes]
MPFGLSGAAPNFQKAVNIILKPVIGRFVSVYMDDVIITSPSFNEHVDHLNQDSFDKIKRALTEAPVLPLPNITEQFNLFTAASGVGIGAVLNQNHRPIAFASRTLNKAVRNYTVSERDCLAVIWALKKFKTYFGFLPVKHRPGVQNVVAHVLSRNPVGNMDGSQISCTALRALSLNSREQLIREQREDPELGHIYRYLENPDDGPFNATVCDGWSQDFKLIDGLLFYAKYSTTLGELRVYIPRSLCEAVMQEFHDLLLAGHLGKRKTYLKLRDTCYFPYMRKYIFEYVSTCERCQKFNYKNALPAGRWIPIVSNYPNEIVTVLEVRNNNLIIWKKGKRVTVNTDQVRVYRPRQSDTISSDSHVETLYEGQRSSNRSSRSQPGKFKGSRKTSSEGSNGRKSNKGNAGWEDPRLKRKVGSNGSRDRKNLKRRPNNPSQGSQSIAGPSHLRNARQGKPPTEGSKHDVTGQYDKARETRTTTSGTNMAAERRPVRS